VVVLKNPVFEVQPLETTVTEKEHLI
jgi:hypothetical protein